MKSLLCVAIGFSLLFAHFSLGYTAVQADELPKDTNKIACLTPEQARKLAEEFRGVKAEVDIKGYYGNVHHDDCLPLNGLKSLDTQTAKSLAGYSKGPLLLNGVNTLDPAPPRHSRSSRATR